MRKWRVVVRMMAALSQTVEVEAEDLWKATEIATSKVKSGNLDGWYLEHSELKADFAVPSYR